MLGGWPIVHRRIRIDRKSTRLNSSHLVISYAVFCLKKNQSNLTSANVPASRRRTLKEFPSAQGRCEVAGPAWITRAEFFFLKYRAPPDSFFLPLRGPLRN